jgi:Tol biopolymer transport system component
LRSVSLKSCLSRISRWRYRSGPEEIWLRGSDGSDRPVITGQTFPPGTTKALMNPSPSPNGDRLIFGRVDLGGVARLWISSLSGGVPVLLTNAEHTLERGGSWSPDGSRFVYVAYEGGKTSLMTVKTSGGATPVRLVDIGKQNDLPTGLQPETGSRITMMTKVGT